MLKITFELSSSSIKIDGESSVIKFLEDNNMYTHKILHEFGEITSLPAGTIEFEWTPTATELTKFLEEIPNQKTRSIDVYLDTYDGEILVGRDIHALTVTLSTSTGSPVYIGTPTIKDNNSVTNSMGVILPGKSNISVSDYSTTRFGAKIVKKCYTYTFN